MNANDENYRRECEAREWINRGYTSKPMVDQLIMRITEIRGKEAAEELRAEMRKQWRLKNDML